MSKGASAFNHLQDVKNNNLKSDTIYNPTRKVPLVLLTNSLDMIDFPTMLRIGRGTTYANLNEELCSQSKNRRYEILQETLGPRPCWRAGNSSRQIPRTTTQLFVVDKETPFVLGVIRSRWGDHPVLIGASAQTSGVIVWDLIRSEIGTDTAVGTVTLYNGNTDIRTSPYDHTAMISLPSYPTVFFITLESGIDSVWRSDWPTSSFNTWFELQLSQCQELLDVAKSCKLLTMQCLHVAEAVMHLLLTSAASYDQRGPFTLERLLDYLEELFGDINDTSANPEQLTHLCHRLDQAFFTCCLNFPGSVDIRRSFTEYVDYGQMDVLECTRTHYIRYETLSSSAQWDLEHPLLHVEDLVEFDPILDEERWLSSEAGPSSTSDLNLGVSVDDTEKSPLVLRSLDVDSSRAPPATAKKDHPQRTFRRMFQDTLRVTGFSRQRDPEMANVTDRISQLSGATDKPKDKSKQTSNNETKRALKFSFTRRPKFSISGQGTLVDRKEGNRSFMGSLRHLNMSSPVLPLTPNPFASQEDFSPPSTSNDAANMLPIRPHVTTIRSSTSSDRDREFSMPLQISRPRALAPTSPTTLASPKHSASGPRGISPSPHRNPSSPSRLTHFPSSYISSIPLAPPASSAFYHSLDTSTTSLTSPLCRENIRTASSLLIKHLSRPPPPLRQQDWQGIEVRLRALSRLEHVWGKIGGGSSSTTVGSSHGFGGGEDHELKLFCEAVRDGYVLCALLNKFRPGTVPRLDPGEDGVSRTSNITEFLAGALHYGVSNSDLFFRNDMLEASSESLGRVARTIIALAKLGEHTVPPYGTSRGPYTSIRDGSTESLSLLDSGQRSPVHHPGRSERYPPPSAPPPVFPIDLAEPTRSQSPQVPSRSPLQPSSSSRTSLSTSNTDKTAGFSSLDNRPFTQFETVRTTTTAATSIHPQGNTSVALSRQEPRSSHPEHERQPNPYSSRELTSPAPGKRPLERGPIVSSRIPHVHKVNSVRDARELPRKNSNESDQMIQPSRGMPRVPFPRMTSGDFAPAISRNVAGPSRSTALPIISGELGHQEARTTDSLPGSPRRASGSPKAVNTAQRVRYSSDLDITGMRMARTNRRTSFDDVGTGARPGRSRLGSMTNLGSGEESNSTESLPSVNALRQPLIVREDGKPSTHYKIGNRIGRGQFGAVYRALNINTGQIVAVKRIGLQGLSEDEISNLMKEVDLLKRLSHPSIVRYEGMVRSTDTLSIVLEYVENGSLGQTLKAFGKLQERLVASYVTKILESLHYLHRSHVVHCDLKAANILTTKDGNVKLADFGVSLNLNTKALETKNDVAGTPNWMAPEVIELKGASTASDIWSLGCTAIELLTGHPPYHEIGNGLSVMFKIVEDDLPPIPDVCSPLMKDFLKQCFVKNPAGRPNAETLRRHPWLEISQLDHVPGVKYTASEADGRQSLDTKGGGASGSLGADGDLKSSTTTPQTGISIQPTPLSSDGLPRSHSFINTPFSRAVTCRVCHKSVRKSAALCRDCGFIAHSRCVADAPPSCDVRTQLLLYSQYSRASNPQEPESPVRPGSRPASSSIAIYPNPSMHTPTRRHSDDRLFSSPKLSERPGDRARSKKTSEPTSPPTAVVARALQSNRNYNNVPVTTEDNDVAFEVTTAARRLGTRRSAASINASEFGEERRRTKRNQRDSVSSKDSQCIVF